MNIQAIKAVATRVVGRTGLQLSKHSPTIFMGIGIVGFGVTIVLTSRAILKASVVIDEAKVAIDQVNLAKAEINPVKYSEEDATKDMMTIYVQTGVKFLKLYGPALVVGGLSIACLVGAHNILNRRNVALMAAYKALEKGFMTYRERVIEEYGAKKDFMYKNGLREEEVIETVTGKDGKTKKVKKTVEVGDKIVTSPYAVWFGEGCTNWSSQTGYNGMFLKGQQNYASDMLRIKGHIFLNEVYDLLGVERTPTGAVCGWVMGKGDDYVDFGIFTDTTDEKEAFLDGYSKNILLDFNVDGVIYDLI